MYTQVQLLTLIIIVQAELGSRLLSKGLERFLPPRAEDHPAEQGGQCQRTDEGFHWKKERRVPSQVGGNKQGSHWRLPQVLWVAHWRVLEQRKTKNHSSTSRVTRLLDLRTNAHSTLKLSETTVSEHVPMGKLKYLQFCLIRHFIRLCFKFQQRFKRAHRVNLVFIE